MAILAQVVLLRELGVAFYGAELVYVLALGLWLAWSAAGATSGRAGWVPGPDAMAWLFALAPAVLLGSLAAIRVLRPALGAVPGAFLPFAVQVGAVLLALAPMGFVAGLLFRWTARAWIARGGTLASAYAIESAGGLVGGALATGLLEVGLGNLDAAAVCGLCAVLGAAPSRRRPTLVATLVLAAALAALLARGEAVDRWLTGLGHPGLVASRDTPYGRVTVVARGGQVVVFENDAFTFESEGTEAEELAHLAALQPARPGRVLLLGGAAHGLPGELLRHRPERLDVVEVDPRALELELQALPVDLSRPLADPRLALHHADPRRFLAGVGGAGGRGYDLIVVAMPEPDSGRTNRYYTRDFFALARSRLAPGGVLAFRLRSAENLWTPLLAQRAASIQRALGEVFADTVVLPGTSNVFLASTGVLERDPEVLAARLRDRGIAGRRVRGAYLRYLYRGDRFGEIERLLAATAAPVNRDRHPVCYGYTLALWLGRFFPGIGRRPLPAPVGDLVASPWPWALALALALVVVLARRRPVARLALLAGLAGLVGMVVETCVILAYQTASGVLYRDLGLLLTAFMAGLWAGSATVAALARARPGRAGDGVSGPWLVLSLAAVAAAAACTTLAGTGPGLVAAVALLGGTGFAVAAVFAWASLVGAADQAVVLGPLYAADLVGGSLGAVVSALLLVPFLGLASTVAAMALPLLAMAALL